MNSFSETHIDGSPARQFATGLASRLYNPKMGEDLSFGWRNEATTDKLECLDALCYTILAHSQGDAGNLSSIQ